MNKAALFCDGTEGYVYPPEPKENELVTFRFRTAKDDVDRVGLVTSADTYVMEKECTQGEFEMCIRDRGNTRWNGKTAGKIMRTPYIRDIVL